MSLVLDFVNIAHLSIFVIDASFRHCFYVTVYTVIIPLTCNVWIYSNKSVCPFFHPSVLTSFRYAEENPSLIHDSTPTPLNGQNSTNFFDHILPLSVALIGTGT